VSVPLSPVLSVCWFFELLLNPEGNSAPLLLMFSALSQNAILLLCSLVL
jgi:hypothetical protein